MIGKAIIPIAGLGTRLWPITKVLPKAMLPLPAADNALLPVMHWICAEAAAAGITHALLVVSPNQRRMVAEYIDAAKGDSLLPLPARVELTDQRRRTGLGAAVMKGVDFAGGEAFMVLLGDHVYIAGRGAKACAAQVAQAHADSGGSAMIGVQPVQAGEISRVGVPRGEPIGRRVYRCTDFVEKPDPRTAQKRLATPGLAAGKYLAHCGIYIFDPEIFDCLAEIEGKRSPAAKNEELQLADAQGELLRRHPEDYYLYRINGRAYDTGTVDNYAKAAAAFARHRLQVGRRG